MIGTLHQLGQYHKLSYGMRLLENEVRTRRRTQKVAGALLVSVLGAL